MLVQHKESPGQGVIDARNIGGSRQITPQSTCRSSEGESVTAETSAEGCAGSVKQAGADLEGPRHGQAYIKARPQPNTPAKKGPQALGDGKGGLGHKAMVSRAQEGTLNGMAKAYHQAVSIAAVLTSPPPKVKDGLTLEKQLTCHNMPKWPHAHLSKDKMKIGCMRPESDMQPRKNARQKAVSEA